MALLLALLLAAAPAHVAHPLCWADGHNHHRSKAAVRAFKRAHPCPGGPDQGSRLRCRGYQVDHIVSLACCGPDAPQNMQWLTDEENRKKGAGVCPGEAK